MKKRSHLRFMFFICVVFFLLVSWIYFAEKGKTFDKRICVYFNGHVVKNALIETQSTRYRWHQLYDTAIVGSDIANKLLERSKTIYNYYQTNEKGEFWLKGHAVWMEVYVYLGAKQYCGFEKNLTPASTIPENLFLTEDDYVAPAFYYRSSFEAPGLKAYGKSAAEITRGENSISIVCYAGSETESRLEQAYRKELSKTHNILYVEVVSDNDEVALVDELPYEVHFHDTGGLFLRFVTIVDSRQEGERAYVRLFVPKGHRYDLSFFPNVTKWPGLYAEQYKVPKPLEPLTIKGLNPTHEGKHPLMVITLRRSKLYRKDWEFSRIEKAR